MHETCAHAVYAVLIFHIAHEIRLFFNAVRLVICRFGSIFYAELVLIILLHICRDVSDQTLRKKYLFVGI